MITSQGKLTLELIKQITDVVEIGCYPEVACESLGISNVTYYKWLKRGQEAANIQDNDSGANVVDTELLYLQFFTAIKKAAALGEIDDVATINRGEKDAIPRLAKLSRRHRKRWADNVQDQDGIRAGAEFLARLVEALNRPQLEAPCSPKYDSDGTTQVITVDK
jgi:hypothetical protein